MLVEERQLERLKWRSRRGLLELDLVFERFWARGAASLAPGEIAAFERLLAMPDNDVLDLVMDRTVTADREIQAIVEKLRAA